MMEEVVERNIPVILTGDWNEVPNGPCVQVVNNNAKVIASNGPSMPAFTTHKSREG